MNGNWGDQNWINQKRQEALNSGWSASDVDKFINQNVEAYTKTQTQGAAAKVLQQQGYATPEQAISNPEAFNAAGVPVKTDEQIKADEKKAEKDPKVKEAEQIIKTLEDLYFKGGQLTGLAKGEKKPGGRLAGRAAELEAKFTPNEQYEVYKRILESSRSKLAKAAGDSGNLALQEQILAGRSLPDMGNTPEEAFALFKETRNKFGLPVRDRLNKIEQNYLKKIGQNKTPDNSQQQPQGNGILDQSVGNILGNIVKSQTVNNPAWSNPITDFLLPANRNITNKLSQGQIPNIDDAKGVAIEDALLVGGGVVGKAAGPAISRFIKPIATASKERTAIAKTVENFGKGNSELQAIAKDMLKDKVPSYTEIPILKDLAKGKAIDGKKALDLLVKVGNKTFTKGGDFKTNQAADYYGVLRDVLRTEFQKKAPQVIKETTNIAKAMPKSAADKEPIQRVLGKIFNPITFGAGIAGAAAGGIGNAFIYKLLGGRD